MGNPEAVDLTGAEMLTVHRRRLGVNQQIMARLLGIGFRKYIRLELGREPVPHELYARLLGVIPPTLDGLRLHERYRIMRLRAGKSREDFATIIGVSPWWITKMENGSAPLDKLTIYWRCVDRS